MGLKGVVFAFVLAAAFAASAVVLAGKSAYYFPVYGTVVATADDTPGGGSYGDVTVGTLPSSGATYKGSVNAQVISVGLFYGSVSEVTLSYELPSGGRQEFFRIFQKDYEVAP